MTSNFAHNPVHLGKWHDVSAASSAFANADRVMFPGQLPSQKQKLGTVIGIKDKCQERSGSICVTTAMAPGVVSACPATSLYPYSIETLPPRSTLTPHLSGHPRTHASSAQLRAASDSVAGGETLGGAPNDGHQSPSQASSLSRSVASAGDSPTAGATATAREPGNSSPSMNLRKWMEEQVRANGMQPFPSLSLSSPLANKKKAIARQRHKQQQQAVLPLQGVDSPRKGEGEKSRQVADSPHSTRAGSSPLKGLVAGSATARSGIGMSSGGSSGGFPPVRDSSKALNLSSAEWEVRARLMIREKKALLAAKKLSTAAGNAGSPAVTSAAAVTQRILAGMPAPLSPGRKATSAAGASALYGKGLLRPRGTATNSSIINSSNMTAQGSSSTMGARASMAGTYEFGPDKPPTSIALAATANESPTGDAAATSAFASRKAGEGSSSSQHRLQSDSGAEWGVAADGAASSPSPSPPPSGLSPRDWWDLTGGLKLSLNDDGLATDSTTEGDGSHWQGEATSPFHTPTSSSPHSPHPYSGLRGATPPPSPSPAPLLLLLREEGFEEEAIQAIALRRSVSLNMDPSLVRERLSFLRSLGLSPSDLQRAICRHPRLLSYPVATRMAPRVQLLREMGLREEDVPRVLLRGPTIFECSEERAIRPCLAYLREEVGLSDGDLVKVLTRSPQLLTQNIESGVAPRVNYLRHSLQMSKEAIASMVTRHPQLLHYSVEEGIKPRVRFLQSIGLSQAEVAHILLRLPQILSLSIDNVLHPKYEYLTNDIGLTATSLVSYPAFFSLSLTGRIQPRHEFIQHLFSAERHSQSSHPLQGGLNKELYTTESGSVRFPLSLLALTDDKFCQRLGFHDDKEYVVFRERFLRRMSLI